MPPAVRGRNRTMSVLVAVLVLASTLVAAPVALAQSTAPSASAEADALWSGAPLPTAEMSADDAAAVDAVAAALVDRVEDEFSGLWLGVWDPAKGVHIAA